MLLRTETESHNCRYLRRPRLLTIRLPGALLVGLAVLGWMWTQAEGWLSLEGPLSPLSMVSSVLPRSAVAAIIAVVIAAAIGSAALLRDGVKD